MVHKILKISYSEKAFDSIQHPFMINTLKKSGYRGTYLNIIRLCMISPQLISHSTVKS